MGELDLSLAAWTFAEWENSWKEQARWKVLGFDFPMGSGANFIAKEFRDELWEQKLLWNDAHEGRKEKREEVTKTAYFA